MSRNSRTPRIKSSEVVGTPSAKKNDLKLTTLETNKITNSAKPRKIRLRTTSDLNDFNLGERQVQSDTDVKVEPKRKVRKRRLPSFLPQVDEIVFIGNFQPTDKNNKENEPTATGSTDGEQSTEIRKRAKAKKSKKKKASMDEVDLDKDRNSQSTDTEKNEPNSTDSTDTERSTKAAKRGNARKPRKKKSSVENHCDKDTSKAKIEQVSKAQSKTSNASTSSGPPEAVSSAKVSKGPKSVSSKSSIDYNLDYDDDDVFKVIPMPPNELFSKDIREISKNIEVSVRETYDVVPPINSAADTEDATKVTKRGNAKKTKKNGSMDDERDKGTSSLRNTRNTIEQVSTVQRKPRTPFKRASEAPTPSNPSTVSSVKVSRRSKSNSDFDDDNVFIATSNNDIHQETSKGRFNDNKECLQKSRRSTLHKNRKDRDTSSEVNNFNKNVHPKRALEVANSLNKNEVKIDENDLKDKNEGSRKISKRNTFTESEMVESPKKKLKRSTFDKGQRNIQENDEGISRNEHRNTFNKEDINKQMETKPKRNTFTKETADQRKSSMEVSFNQNRGTVENSFVGTIEDNKESRRKSKRSTFNQEIMDQTKSFSDQSKSSMEVSFSQNRGTAENSFIGKIDDNEESRRKSKRSTFNREIMDQRKSSADQRKSSMEVSFNQNRESITDFEDNESTSRRSKRSIFSQEVLDQRKSTSNLSGSKNWELQETSIEDIDKQNETKPKRSTFTKETTDQRKSFVKATINENDPGSEEDDSFVGNIEDTEGSCRKSKRSTFNRENMDQRKSSMEEGVFQTEDTEDSSDDEYQTGRQGQFVTLRRGHHANLTDVGFSETTKTPFMSKLGSISLGTVPKKRILKRLPRRETFEIAEDFSMAAALGASSAASHQDVFDFVSNTPGVKLEKFMLNDRESMLINTSLAPRLTTARRSSRKMWSPPTNVGVCGLNESESVPITNFADGANSSFAPRPSTSRRSSRKMWSPATEVDILTESEANNNDKSEHNLGDCSIIEIFDSPEPRRSSRRRWSQVEKLPAEKVAFKTPGKPNGNKSKSVIIISPSEQEKSHSKGIKGKKSVKIDSVLATPKMRLHSPLNIRKTPYRAAQKDNSIITGNSAHTPPSHTSTPFSKAKDTSGLLKKALGADQSSNNKMSSRSKMPDFKKIHEMQNQKLENIKEFQERKALRAQYLLSGAKPPPVQNVSGKTEKESRKQLKFTPKANKKSPAITILSKPLQRMLQKRSSLEKQKKRASLERKDKKTALPGPKRKSSLEKQKKRASLEKKDKKNAPLPGPSSQASAFTIQDPKYLKPKVQTNGFTRFGFKATTIRNQNITKDDQIKAVSSKTKIIGNKTEEHRKVLKNVRTNRRFELLMEMRGSKK